MPKILNRMLVAIAPFLALAVCLGFSTPPTQGAGALEITVDLQFNGKPLILADQAYRSAVHDSLYIDLLRFYLTAFRLQGITGQYTEPDSYHLIDAEAPGSQTIRLNGIPAGRYDSLLFNVGADSLTNVSGAQGGDLDPTRGMYWAWNSGYINVKLEGRSPACPTRHHAFEFHIGGYMPPHPTVRRVALPLKGLTIQERTTTSLRLVVDVARFFDKVELGKTNQVMIPSAEAARLADCFQGVFHLGE